MDGDRWEDVKALFGEALAQPPARRAAFLDDACGEDAALRAQVASLLASYDEASGYFGDLADAVLGPGWMIEEEDGASSADPHRLIGQTVSHYEVLEKLGGGGMGVVYKARDTRLGRLVALKFLPPHLGADASAKERFVREAQAASALDHVNVGTIHEIDETGEGQLFIAMAYYEGETLTARLARGALPVDEALDITVQIARGLARAHRRGIVHRDVKPGNVMLTEPGSTAAGSVKLIDFGVAKVADVTLTAQGARLGTVAYMSPEQVLGKPVDARTDIWALGAVLYEMLSGARPFQGVNEAAVIHAIVDRPPAPIDTVRSEVPADVARVVHRALMKKTADRFQTMEALLDALRRIHDTGSRARPAAPPVEARHPGERAGTPTPVVVGPFRNLNPDPDTTALCDELTARITADLSALPHLRVISSMPGRDAQEDAEPVGGASNARYVLEGSVRRAGDRVRITVRVIDEVRDRHLWAAKYTGTLDDVGSDVSGAVAEALRTV